MSSKDIEPEYYKLIIHGQEISVDDVVKAITKKLPPGIGFRRGNEIKYLARAGLKDPTREGYIRDLQKARKYINLELEDLYQTEGQDKQDTEDCKYYHVENGRPCCYGTPDKACVSCLGKRKFCDYPVGRR